MAESRVARRRRRRNFAFSMMLIIMMLLIILIASIVYSIIYINSAKGAYVYKYDITDEVVADAALWLSDVEGVDIDTDWVKSHTAKIELDVIFELEKESFAKGIYKISIRKSSYEECAKSAEELVVGCMEEIIERKLAMSGYRNNISADELSNTINDILGAEMGEYLKSNGILMIPSYESLNGRVSDEGTYNMNIRYINRNGNSGLRKERYIIDGENLIFPEQGRVYRKQVEK